MPAKKPIEKNQSIEIRQADYATQVLEETIAEQAFADGNAIRRLHQVKDIDQLESTIAQILRTLGFSSYCYYNLNASPLDWSKGRGRFTNFPKELLKEYDEGSFAEHDVIVHYGKLNTGDIYYTDLFYEMVGRSYKTQNSVANIAIRNLYTRFGYDELYLIPEFNERGRTLFVVGDMLLKTTKNERGNRRASDTPPEGPPSNAGDPNGVVLLQQPNGTFQLEAVVDRAEVLFVVDTGASEVMLTPADALRVGVKTNRLRFNLTFATANGDISAARVSVGSLTCGPIQMRDISVHVSALAMDHSLLGQSFLDRLSGYEVAGGRMVLKP